MFDLLTPMVPQPVTLRNEHVTLEPLTTQHTRDLCDALDDGVFEFMPMRSNVKTMNEVRRYIEFHIKRPDTITFAVIDNATERAIGSTSYLHIRNEHRGLEIGSTWITESARGTKINPSMKYLMLEHAFETLGVIRVDIRTDSRNTVSRRAIEKLGAQFEGILRAHMIMPDKALRDTAVYSITCEEWPTVKETLLVRLAI